MEGKQSEDLRKQAARLVPALRMCLAGGCRPLPRLAFLPGVGSADGADIAGERSLTLPGRKLAEAADPVPTLLEFFSGRDSEDLVETSLCLWPGYGAFRIESTVRSSCRRLEGKVAIVTGAAQGFGRGIAFELAEQGAFVVLADRNGPAVDIAAAELNTLHGAGRALALTVDVGSEPSVAAMIEETLLAFGGLDLMVSNAGVLRAGGLEDLSLEDFELVTHVNYTAFFLCSKYASVPMKTASRIDPGHFSDIIQVNSKSGLQGSNRNFAYAGGKFGGIGLVQSFALELAPHRIKVNAVCPGNYLDGPLWSDPDNGLFLQYLRAGKVPGARTVQDVRNAYEAKVPLGRGCQPADVARAIVYLVEQEYETGQALPVTGGQVMLN